MNDDTLLYLHWISIADSSRNEKAEKNSPIRQIFKWETIGINNASDQSVNTSIKAQSEQTTF